MRSHAKASSAGSTQRRAVRPLGLALLLSALLALLGSGSALAAAPTIPSTTVSAVSTSTAVLEAEINPEGEATTYQFEYGLADCSSNPCASLPAAPLGIGSGTNGVKVAKEVSGLEPGTTYHFLVVATNPSGTTKSADRVFATYGTFVPETDCPNQAVRYGPSALLADCRAYEMVSPVEKDGGEIVGSISSLNYELLMQRSSPDGRKFTFTSFKSFGDQISAVYSNQYMASRGSDGWSSHGINPPQTLTVFDPGFFLGQLDHDYQDFTPDLSSAWVMNFNKTPLTPDGLAGYINLYRRDNLDGGFEALTNAGPFAPTSPDLGGNGNLALRVKGFSQDASHQLFSTRASLTPEAPAGEDMKLYELFEGELRLVSVLRNGEPATGNSYAGFTPSSGSKDGIVENVVSDDGSRIFWTAEGDGDGGTIYARIDGANTVPVSTPITSERAQYWTASSDGSKVVFTTGAVFTGQAKLYVADVDAESGTPIAEEVVGVAGASEDASHIYFVSKDVLDAGATAGEFNLYLYREGEYFFVATVAADDLNIAARRPLDRPTRVTPDGRSIAFMSSRSLTGYDNTDAVSGEPDLEAFVYDAQAEELACASCNPSGARPRGARLYAPYANKREFMLTNEWAAGWIPTWEWENYASRALAVDGNRLFFNSYDSLVPRDTNGVQDVYQWEAPGTGSCEAGGSGYSDVNKGCVSLISTGTSPLWSEFADASSDGDSVFFRTASSIDPADPGLIDLYVARIGGGYPQIAAANPCVGDACQSPPPPPSDATPASANLRGASDPVASKARRRCRAARATRKGRAAGKQAKKRAQRCRRANRRPGR